MPDAKGQVIVKIVVSQLILQAANVRSVVDLNQLDTSNLCEVGNVLGCCRVAENGVVRSASEDPGLQGDFKAWLWPPGMLLMFKNSDRRAIEPNPLQVAVSWFWLLYLIMVGTAFTLYSFAIFCPSVVLMFTAATL